VKLWKALALWTVGIAFTLVACMSAAVVALAVLVLLTRDVGLAAVGTPLGLGFGQAVVGLLVAWVTIKEALSFRRR
jgi:hypothetical protein